MTRKIQSLLFVPVAAFALLTGCGTNSTPTAAVPGASVPVSLSMTDDPPAGVSVLFFQVSLTGATLNSSSGSSVSLLSNNTPIQVDVTQLQALSAFLSTANVTPGTYSSLNLTFANPELVIFNQSDSSLASTCAVGSVCQLTPPIDSSATVSLSASPFPVTVSASSPLGFLVDFHLNTVIQSDLSVDLGVANGVSVVQLPPPPQQPQYGSVTGEVETVSASSNQFTMLTSWGRTFTVGTTSGTTFSGFPSSACTTAGIGCLASGQVLQVQVASLGSGGVLTASQVTYVQAPSQQTAEGTIIGLQTSSSGTVMKLILHNAPGSNSAIPLGGEATVSIASNATWSVASNGFTIPSGLNFTGAGNLMVGQNVEVSLQSGTLTSTEASNWGGWGPPHTLSFTASSVTLEPSQITGTISALTSSSQSFTLDFNQGPYFAPWPMGLVTNTATFNVETTSQTTYQGFTPASYDGLETQDLVSVSGWLFPPASSSGSPQIAAQSVVLHSGGLF